jgi:signal transduction histidine kinase
MFQTFRSAKKFLTYHALVIWRTKSFWMRALLCWVIGAALLVNDEHANYDLRLQIRGPRPATAGVVIVDISEKDWVGLAPDRNVLRPLKEVMNFTDGFFWHAATWNHLLSRVLEAEPAVVGVTFYFGDNIRLPSLTSEMRATFDDPRIIWGAELDSTGRVVTPVFAGTFNANVGLKTLRADDDGSVRRFATSLIQVPHIAVRMAEIADPSLSTYAASNYQASTLINYIGGASSFTVVNFRDVLEGRIKPELFRNHVVVVGSLSNTTDQVQTPLGRMSRVEVIANTTDNILSRATVQRLPNWIYLMTLALLIGASIWVLLTYPQAVALVIFIMASIVWSSASAWAFDSLHFWVPVLSPLLQIMITYIVFLSYQLALNEQRAWRLVQERKYTYEIEQLKSNFVSMMSHDLKTPIAKIQAICDRLLTAAPQHEFATDLRSLRRSSDDLHRYIQSILQVTRIEAKDFKVTKEVTDINDDIEKVVARLKPLAAEKNIVITTDLEPMFSIEADPHLIQEVIHNLVENAIKYTPALGRVTVSSQEKDDNVVVVVEDTGPGIAPEDQKDIWGKFTRGRQVSADIKGTGLGLYLVKYFIELHGGSVFVESQPARGTRIGFQIPIAEDTPPELTMELSG